MPRESVRDARRVLVQDKYFSLRPKPLERWLWRQGVALAAERVFWLHWEEGMRRGDWCSELSLKQVARECCIDTSTVTRAYQVLKSLGLLRREDPGRDPHQPFLQAIAITEVLLPQGLLQQLHLAPNRPKREAQVGAGAGHAAPMSVAMQVRPERPGNELKTSTGRAGEPAAPALSRAESAALMSRLSAAERAAFFVASRDRSPHISFDPDTALSIEEQGHVRGFLSTLCANSASDTAPRRQPARSAPVFAPPRQLSPLEAARLRKGIGAVAGKADAADLFRQVLWSLEEGALRRFEPRLAANIALKKIREGAWSRPNRMPPQWLRRALPETCSAA